MLKKLLASIFLWVFFVGSIYFFLKKKNSLESSIEKTPSPVDPVLISEKKPHVIIQTLKLKKNETIFDIFTDLKFSETSNQSISRKRQNIKINNITPTKDPTSVGTEKNLGLNDLGDKGSFDIYKIQSIKFLSGRLDGIPVRLGNLYGVDSIFIRYTIKSFGANPGVSTILDIGGVHPRYFMQLIDS